MTETTVTDANMIDLASVSIVRKLCYKIENGGIDMRKRFLNQ